VDVRFVLPTFIRGQLAFIALPGEFVDVSLRLGNEAKLDELPRHVRSEYAAKRIEQAVEYRYVQSLHEAIVTGKTEKTGARKNGEEKPGH
jgi:hypothetical protein